MPKKIIAVVSSPRKGNSEILVDQFIAGAETAGNVTEKICLREKNINYCRGCGYCMRSGGICVQKDDMTEILRKMHEADVIVLSTPVYKSCMCAQLKTLIDRMFAGNSILINKEFYCNCGRFEKGNRKYNGEYERMHICDTRGKD